MALRFQYHPKRNPREVLSRLLACTLVAQALSWTATAQTMEQNIDRPGQSYATMVPDPADPSVCSRRCDEDERCQAWTFVRPPRAGAPARCWLKEQVPLAKPDRCCISGLKPAKATSANAPPVGANAPPGPAPNKTAPEVRTRIGIDNKGSVRNGPTTASAFALKQTARLLSLTTYHWNFGRGDPPGRIALRFADGRILGPWQASGLTGSNGVANATGA